MIICHCDKWLPQYKSSWEFSRKEECNTLIKHFSKPSILKKKNFLELTDINNNPSIPSYIKEVLKGTECTTA